MVDKYLKSFVNHSILRSYFSDGAKDALARLIYKNNKKAR